MNCAHFRKLLLLLALTGCQVGPQYETPQMDVPNEWHISPSAGVSTGSTDCFLWWESLNDPTLNSLIERAAHQNLDLLIAGTRILEARLKRKGVEAQRYPHIDASATMGHLYWSKDLLKKGILDACSCHHKHSCHRNVNFFELGFDAEWEIDLFGFHKHEANAAEARLESVEESLSDVWVTLSAEIARNYIELRGTQHHRSLLLRNIQNLQESVQLTAELLEMGITNRIDVLQIEEQMSLLMAQKPLLDFQIDQVIHRLSILLGYPPGELFAELSEPQGLPSLPFKKPIGVPSELLRRRPDIRRAERNLAAATESVGSAVAALFPRLSLYGFVGQVGTQLRSLTNSSGTTWFAAPQLLFPIFNSRLLKQDVEMNKILARQALFEYQKKILESFEEVENALASLRSQMKREQELQHAQQIDEEAYHLTFQLYQRGVKDYLEVLSTKRTLLKLEEIHLQNQVDLLISYLSLYKALGGSWDLSHCN